MNYTSVVLLKHFPLWHFLVTVIKTFMLRISKGHFFFFFFNFKGLWLTLFKAIPPPFMGNSRLLGGLEQEPLVQVVMNLLLCDKYIPEDWISTTTS